MSTSMLDAAILGLVQGLTEFLPVSSSAHLRILGELLPSGADPGAAFTAITQLGTEAAVLLYFWSDIRRIGTAWTRRTFLRDRSVATEDLRMGWLIILGSLPIIVLGLLFKDDIETGLRNLYITAFALIFFGILLGVADRFGRRVKPLSAITWRDGILFGFAQAMALVPGVSRSGGTITAGLIMGYTREAAARYSFLLALPAVFGSGFYQLVRSIGAEGGVGWLETLVATVIAFVVGYGVIVLFLRLVSTQSYLPFTWYRIALGLFILAMLQLGYLSPL